MSHHVRILVLTLVIVLCPAFAADLHVSPGGNDTNAGTEQAPLATVAGARDAVRTLRAASGWTPQPITLLVHPGRYVLTESWTLAESDGGAADAPIAYRATGPGVVFVGGKDIPADVFQPVTAEADLKLLAPEAQSGVMKADLRALGIEDLGTFPDNFENAPPLPELFFNDERMTLARWPNEGWATVAKVIESGPAPWRNHASDSPNIFEYEGDRPARWIGQDVWLHGYWCFDWSAETIRVGTIDTATRQITLGKQHHYGLGSGNPAPRRYYATNLLAELDVPGEYYIDRAAGTLYFWPPAPLAEGRTVLSTLAAPVILLDHVSYVSLIGLGVEACVGTGIEVRGGRHVALRCCSVRNTGQAGVVISDGDHHRVSGCDIHDTGTAGLHVGGGDRKTLTPCNHVVENNHIWRVSRRQRTHAYNIHMSGVGIRVAHNLIHDAPHQAIGLGGNDHVIEFNDIHHSGQETDDSGAYYMGRNPSERGTIIRNNYWHDIGSALTHGSCAIYFDDGSGGQTVEGNVFYRAAGGSFGAVFVHGGHDNTASNNIFIECKRAIGSAPWDDQRWWDYVKAELWQRVLLQDVDITKPPYTERYPDLVGFMEPNDRPRVNAAANNVVVQCGAFLNGNWEDKGNFVTDSDPGFVDVANQNFALREDSIVFTRLPGFTAIPFAEIGLLPGTERAEFGLQDH
ncbi:MAG: right-handed parallel beta-helix repeat-containing protein [Candidatus Hydrogenedentes bacterium]|nr:right-handed parallel beta-helix repeat-containing protein [Candidatus Hydrogenedentota bacterium]